VYLKHIYTSIFVFELLLKVFYTALYGNNRPMAYGLRYVLREWDMSQHGLGYIS